VDHSRYDFGADHAVHMSRRFVVSPFRSGNPRSGRWVKARYKPTSDEIAAHYQVWGLIGPGEVRRPSAGYFTPMRRAGE